MVRRLLRHEGNERGRTSRVEGIVVGVIELEVECLIEDKIEVVDLGEDLEPSTKLAPAIKDNVGDVSNVWVHLKFAEWSMLETVCMYCTVNMKQIRPTG